MMTTIALEHNLNMSNMLESFTNQSILLKKMFGELLITILLCSLILLFARRFLRRRNRSKFAYFGKVVIITGASSGIGESLALLYASLGASLVLAARRLDKLQSVADKCSKFGSNVVCVQADVSKEEDCKKLIEKAIDETGRIDILILNAGITMLKRLDELKNLDGVKELMDVNFWGAVYCTFHALKHLKESGGTICVVSSLLGKGWAPTRTAYAASKHALDGFFHSLRLEVKRS
jgi:NAD(P)-dependent dehydrogenase (short-subunit alcohol dehydrogenase family)